MLTAVMAYGRSGGSSRVRVFDWLDYLKLEANTFVYSDGASNSVAEIMAHPGKYFLRERELRSLPGELAQSNLILSRRASPLSNGSVEKRLLSSARKGVYDFDDAIMLSGGRGPGSLISDSRRWKYSVAAADIVIAGNSYLADAASQMNKDVVVIPSCVDPAIYNVKQDYSLVSSNPIAVWLGSPSTEVYLKEIEDALLHEHRRSGLRLKLISKGQQDLGKLARMTDRVDWNLASFAHELVDADFGIMPLKDTDWARGKCAYKLLQYAAAGLPSIASPVGANRAAIDTFGSLDAMSSKEWGEALADMVDSTPMDRERMGQRSRQGVQESYSYAAWSDTWMKVVC